MRVKANSLVIRNGEMVYEQRRAAAAAPFVEENPISRGTFKIILTKNVRIVSVLAVISLQIGYNPYFKWQILKFVRKKERDGNKSRPSVVQRTSEQ